MNAKATTGIAVLTFVLGVVSGVAGTRSSLFARVTESGTAVQQGAPVQGAPQENNLRDALKSLFKQRVFILSGTEDYSGRCSTPVQVSGIHDDYMTVQIQSNKTDFILPYGAIYRIDRVGPGNYEVPVIYTTAFPHAKFCGD